MASVAPAASEAAAADEQVIVKLAAVSLSASTNREDLWRDKGITFRPYQDERDMVGSPLDSTAAPHTAIARMRSQAALAGHSGRHG